LDRTDLWHHAARKRIRLTHTRRRG
jgi:hypothetical protein